MPFFVPVRFCLLTLIAASSLAAQTAALRGQVTDESGAYVPSARVTATSVSSNVATVTTAGSDGTYIFPNLAPGDYTVLANAPSLSLAQPTKVTLPPTGAVLNLQLRVALTTQQV